MRGLDLLGVEREERAPVDWASWAFPVAALVAVLVASFLKAGGQ